MVIRKPHGGAWIDKWNSIKCSTKFPIDFCWRQTPQDVCSCNVDLSVVKWSLRIWTSSTCRCVLPAYEKNQDHIYMATGLCETFICLNSFLDILYGSRLVHCRPRVINISCWNWQRTRSRSFGIGIMENANTCDSLPHCFINKSSTRHNVVVTCGVLVHDLLLHSFSMRSANSGLGSPRIFETESLQLISVIHSLRWPKRILVQISFQEFSRRFIARTKIVTKAAPTFTTSSLWTRPHRRWQYKVCLVSEHNMTSSGLV